MNRVEAIRSILAEHPDAAVIFCNGLTSREASFAVDRPGNFYLLHAMGEALAVGIGLRSARPDLEVVVIDGDGNAAMGLAVTTLLPVPGLHYYVLQNKVYETTGAQPVPWRKDPHPAIHFVPIQVGSLDAPIPPTPEHIVDRFRSWLAARQSARGV